MGRIRRLIGGLLGFQQGATLVSYDGEPPTILVDSENPAALALERRIGEGNLPYIKYDGTERGLAKATEESTVVRLSRQVTELTYALQEAKRELDRRDHELQVAGVEQHNAMEFVRQANLGRHGEIMAFKEKNDALLAAFQEKTEEMKLAEQSQLRKENDELVLEVMRLRGQLQGQLSAGATRRLLADQNGE